MSRLFKLVIAIVITVSLATYLILAIFTVKNISLPLQNCLTENDLQVVGKLIFRIDANSIEAVLKKKFACLDQLKISKQYPAKLVISVVTKIPSLAIAETNWGITPEGLVVESSQADLPQLFMPQAPQLIPGQKIIDEKILFAAGIANLLSKTDFLPQTVRILQDGDVAVYDKDATAAIFSLKKKKEEQVDSLQQVLAAAKIDGDKIAKIDLRFDKPVITFK